MTTNTDDRPRPSTWAQKAASLRADAAALAALSEEAAERYTLHESLALDALSHAHDDLARQIDGLLETGVLDAGGA